MDWASEDENYEVFLVFFSFLVISCQTTSSSELVSERSKNLKWSCQSNGDYWKQGQCYRVSVQTKQLACEAGSGEWYSLEEHCQCSSQDHSFDWNRKLCSPKGYVLGQQNEKTWRNSFAESDHCLFSKGHWNQTVCQCPVGTKWDRQSLTCKSIMGYQYDCPGVFEAGYCYERNGEELVYSEFFGWISGQRYIENPSLGYMDEGQEMTMKSHYWPY